MRIKITVSLFVAVLLSVGASGQRPPSWTTAVDAIFADVTSTESPGCAVAVFREGRIAYERGYGMADLEHDVPITPASVFYVGSLSKQFTAFAVALAAGDGKLSLADPVRRWIPELPDYGAQMTVRHLVHHTSGLRDYNTVLDIAGRRNDEAFDNPTVLRIVARQRALTSNPAKTICTPTAATCCCHSLSNVPRACRSRTLRRRGCFSRLGCATRSSMTMSHGW
jgi:CubicO group peptidase (beta-lactamase class C family)